VSSERLILWVTVATLIVAIISVIVTVVYGEIERRRGRKELRLVQEQATLRPAKVAYFKRVAFYPPLSPLLPSDAPSPYPPQVAIAFEIANNGRSAAHNVSCKFHLDA
jgi:hypothetical protein